MLNNKKHLGSQFGLGTIRFGQQVLGLSLDSIFATYNFTNMWSAENITDGANLIAHDYAGEHDLSSSGYTKPTINSSDANFNSKQSLSFVTANTQGLSKSVANWRGSDNEGMITYIIKGSGTLPSYPLGSANNAALTRYVAAQPFFNYSPLTINDGSSSSILENSAQSSIIEMGVIVVTITSNGTTNKLFINGIEQSLGVTTSNWFNDVTARDNITIGMLVRSSTNHGSMDWTLSGYNSTVLSDADIVAMHQDFMTYYAMAVPLAMSQFDQLNGIVNGWNFDFLNVNGTTTTAFDLKGQYDMSNPAAANQPILSSTELTFDGIDDYLYNGVSDYRISDSSGVLHFYIDNLAGLRGMAFTSADELTSAIYLFFEAIGSDVFRFIGTKGGGFPTVGTDSTYTGKHSVSIVYSGAVASIIVDGVVVPSTPFSMQWFDYFTGRDNISIGAVIRFAPTYTPLVWSATVYTPYVDIPTAIAENNKLSEIVN